MYESDPGAALLFLARAHSSAPDVLKPILWAEHVVADSVWRQEHGFLGADQVDPDALKELQKLSKHEYWWSRLYVAQMMRKHPAFRRRETIVALKQDKHPLVRRVATFITSQNLDG